jgi:hypothetical protein
MRHWLLVLGLALPLGAQAQDATTRLTLAETGMATRLPDVPVASLRAEARAASAAAAQQQLNRIMTAALEEARGVAGVTPATGRYAAQRVDENRAWLASQVLTLRGRTLRATELVGSLQGRGLGPGGNGLAPFRRIAARAPRGRRPRQGIAVAEPAGVSGLPGNSGLRVLRIERLALDTTLGRACRRAWRRWAPRDGARAVPRRSPGRKRPGHRPQSPPRYCSTPAENCDRTDT